MEEKATFQTYGFDEFIGKAFHENGYVSFVSLDMKSMGSFVFGTGDPLDFLLKKLCLAVKDGRKVLFSRSPGKTGLREVSVADLADVVKKAVSGDENYPVKRRWEVHESVTYEALNPDGLKKLQEMYEKKIDMKLYPNPFLYQPE